MYFRILIGTPFIAKFQHAEMILYWDMSYFYMAIGNIPLSNMIWLKNSQLEVDAREDDFSLDFRTTLTCLFFAELETIFTIQERDHEWNIFFNSEASVFGLLPSSILANATLDSNDLANSVIHNFDLKLAGGFFELRAQYQDGILSGNFEIPSLVSHGNATLEGNDIFDFVDN